MENLQDEPYLHEPILSIEYKGRTVGSFDSCYEMELSDGLSDGVEWRQEEKTTYVEQESRQMDVFEWDSLRISKRFRRFSVEEAEDNAKKMNEIIPLFLAVASTTSEEEESLFKDLYCRSTSFRRRGFNFFRALSRRDARDESSRALRFKTL